MAAALVLSDSGPLGRLLNNRPAAVFMPSGEGAHRETLMRLLQISLIGAALLASITAGHAQSAYDYPWCPVYTSNRGAGGAMSCYYRSYGECMRTMSGIGGYCVQSPYYRGGRYVGRRRPRDYRNY